MVWHPDEDDRKGETDGSKFGGPELTNEKGVDHVEKHDRKKAPHHGKRQPEKGPANGFLGQRWMGSFQLHGTKGPRESAHIGTRTGILTKPREGTSTFFERLRSGRGQARLEA